MKQVDLDDYICIPATATQITSIYNRTGIQCARWLDENCIGKSIILHGQATVRAQYLVYFENEVDAIMFKLRWI